MQEAWQKLEDQGLRLREPDGVLAAAHQVQRKSKVGFQEPAHKYRLCGQFSQDKFQDISIVDIMSGSTR